MRHLGYLVVSLALVIGGGCSALNRGAGTGTTDATELQAGHSSHGEAFNEGPRQAAYLIPGTGAVAWPVTTTNPEAQAFFNQGLGQLYGFWYFEAERSFRQVALLDPNCAMAYWGMALANINNEKRARGFCEKAMPLRRAASARERRHIEAINAFYQSKKKKNEREVEYVAALKAISEANPDDLESQALLVRYRWEYRGSLKPKIEDQEADEKILQGIFAKQPNHPAHHFRIHLWDDKNSERALPSAAQCGQSAPGIAHMWHMPGHTYSRLKRFQDAAWQQEASARVDHAQMQRDRIMPDQIHNYAHNNEWLCRDLLAVGRVREAILLAENMRSLPRHPTFNTPKKGSGKYGTERLFDIYYQYEMWDDLVRFSDQLLAEGTTEANDRANAQAAKGIALSMLGRSAEAELQRQVLVDLVASTTKEQEQAGISAKRDGFTPDKSDDDESEAAKSDDKKKKPDPADVQARKVFEPRLKVLNQAVAEMDAARALAQQDAAGAREQLKNAKDMPKWRLAWYHHRLGDTEEAEKTISTWAKDKQQEQKVQPLAQLAWLLWQMGKRDEAITAFTSLRSISMYCDHEHPVFARLAPIAAAANQPEDWRAPVVAATDVGVRPDLATLGPFRWQPTPAPAWHCSDAEGRSHGLADYRGKPVIVIFYLGAGCVHCTEQLQAFAPQMSAFAKAGIAVVGISTETQGELLQSLTKAKGVFPIPLFADPTLEIFKRYRAYDDFEQKPLHGTFLIDGNGLVRWQDISYEPFMKADFLLAEAKRLLAL